MCVGEGKEGEGERGVVSYSGQFKSLLRDEGLNDSR